MPINDDVSKPIKLIEKKKKKKKKNIEPFQMDQFMKSTVSLLIIYYKIHMCYKCWQISFCQIKIIIT